MKALTLWLSIFSATFLAAFSQDTIRVFQYNLLFYGTGSRPITDKDNLLKTIISYVKPDIFGANEIGNDPSFSQNILNSVLISLDGPGSWDKGTYTNFANANLTNMLFYKTANLGIKSEKVVTGFVRDMNIYNMCYYKPGYDSVFFTVAVVHLKAGNTSTNRTRRNNMATALMDTLNNMNPEYLIVMGDMNFYYSNEPGFQTFTNYPNLQIRLRDPANRVGYWHINSAFADVHTQSTRTTDIGDGGARGGLDDRFDFILMNSAFFTPGATIEYIPNSYTTVGQDGQHFDIALVDPPTNTSVPSNVLNALYLFSDHLPVYVDLKFNPPPVPLPAINVNLTLSQQDDYIVVQWDNPINLDVDQFILEKAYSPGEFFQVAMVENDKNSFVFIDREPKKGANYYRIKMITRDGNIETSNVELLFFSPTRYIDIVNLYPNPADKVINVNIQTVLGEKIQWKIINTLGEEVLAGEEVLDNNFNLMTVNVENLPSGIYVLKVNNKSVKFIKE